MSRWYWFAAIGLAVCLTVSRLDAQTVRECPHCYRTYEGDDKLFCSADGTRLVEVSARKEGHESPVRQWVLSTVNASSQGGTKLWSADQVIGPPDSTNPGRDGKGWSPQRPDDGIEWIVVQYKLPVFPLKVRIRESVGPGFVTRVDGFDSANKSYTLWQGEDTTKAGTEFFEITTAHTTKPINRLKITIDSAKVKGWNEIDAIELIGYVEGYPTPTDDLPAKPRPTPPGSIADGIIGFANGSIITSTISQEGKQFPFVVSVLFVGRRTVGFSWQTGSPVFAAGFRQITQENLGNSMEYDDNYVGETVDTLVSETSVWISRRLYQDLKERRRATIRLAQVSTFEARLHRTVTYPVTVNGEKLKLPALDVRLGQKGRMLVLDDPNTPLVLSLALENYSTTVTALEKVVSRLPGGVVPTAATPEWKPPKLPVYNTPDEVFEAWKTAIVNMDKSKLITCYRARERSLMERNAQELSRVILRYRRSLKENKYKITSRTDGASSCEWKWEIRVSELLWTTKVKETIRLVKEEGSWRLYIEPRY